MGPSHLRTPYLESTQVYGGKVKLEASREKKRETELISKNVDQKWSSSDGHFFLDHMVLFPPLIFF